MITSKLLTAKNGRHYVRLPNGQTRFVSKAEAKRIAPDQVFEQDPKRGYASVFIDGTPEVDFNEKQVGVILRGFVEAARGTTDDVERVFGDEPDPPRSERLLLELGREVFGHLPVAVTYFEVSPDEWASWFKNANRTMPAPSRPSTPVQLTLSPTAWLPPVIGKVTSRFGEQRDNAAHEGVDVACAVGTPVIAPVDLKVREVNFGGKAGRFVVADAVRDNGGFEGDGYRLTFAHLSDAQVAEGQIVQRGQPIALSGATGQVTGPHLHFRVEWVDDGVFRDKSVMVDPLGLISEAVFAGAASPTPIVGGPIGALTDDGKPINVIVAPGAGRISIGHGIINPDTDVRVQSPTTELQSFLEDPFEGILNVASQVVQAVASPENLRSAGNAVSTVAKLIGAVQPETLPVAVPVSVGGAVVAAGAEPISNIVKGADPFEGIV